MLFFQLFNVAVQIESYAFTKPEGLFTSMPITGIYIYFTSELNGLIKKQCGVNMVEIKVFPGEYCGSVVECLTRDRTIMGSRLNGHTALCP